MFNPGESSSFLGLEVRVHVEPELEFMNVEDLGLRMNVHEEH